jgi:hypothetical protein
MKAEMHFYENAHKKIYVKRNKRMKKKTNENEEEVAAGGGVVERKKIVRGVRRPGV